MRPILRRLLELPALLLVVVTITFALVQLAPGDAADVLVAPGATADDLARLRATFGLDRTPLEQYARYVRRALMGDLGWSVSHGRPVTAVLRDALPPSLWLGGSSLVATFVIGLTVGAWQAARRGRPSDVVATLAATTVGATPSYWLALVAITLVTSGAAAWDWPAWARLPAFGMHDPALAALGTDSLADRVRHALLPVGVLAIVGAAGISRYARATLVAGLTGLPARTAAAKGCSPARVRWAHAARASLGPLVVLAALALPGIVAGSVFVESLFAWPGMGRTLLQAIGARDLPVVLGCTLLFAVVVALSNLAADLLLAWLDPRQRDEARAP
jgi:peptide/nickel transport system permease protein